MALRRALVASFTARRYRPRLNERMRRQAAALTQQVAIRSHADLMGQFAERFAGDVIAAFVGVPLADTAFHSAGGPRLLPLLPKERLLADAELRAGWPGDLDAAVEFRLRLLDQIERRGASPRGDLLSDLALAVARPDGAVALGDAVAMVDFTLQAVDSLASLISLTMLEIAARPDVMAAVVREPRLAGAAIEEALRLGAVERGTFRRTTRPVRIGGALIPEDAVVLVWLESANRDGRRFERPHEFLLDRHDGQRHVAFGRGRHRCLGASLVRRAAGHAVGALVDGLGLVRPSGRSPLRYHPALLEHTVVAATVERSAS